MEDVLNFLNKLIREEHGNKLTMDSMFIDAGVDSFGITVVFLEMDEKYPGKFNNDWFKKVTNWETLSVKYIVERAVS